MTNHMNDELSRANSHKNDEKISRIILIGLSEIVNINNASGVPKARKAQPKNSANVIATARYFLQSRRAQLV